MSSVREALIRCSEKVIGHYRFLYTSAKSDHERDLYRTRMEREQRLLDDLRSGLGDRRAA